MGEGIRCPACGEELGFMDEVFVAENTDTVAGCGQCLRRHNAVEWLDGAADAFEADMARVWAEE
jgi:uncharacterized Zn finger protein